MSESKSICDEAEYLKCNKKRKMLRLISEQQGNSHDMYRFTFYVVLKLEPWSVNMAEIRNVKEIVFQECRRILILLPKTGRSMESYGYLILPKYIAFARGTSPK